MAKIKKLIRKRLLRPIVSGGAAWVAGIVADRLLHAGLRRLGNERRRGSLGRSAATAALAGTAEYMAVRGARYALARVLGKKKR
jgi:hypothetical protein